MSNYNDVAAYTAMQAAQWESRQRFYAEQQRAYEQQQAQARQIVEQQARDALELNDQYQRNSAERMGRTARCAGESPVVARPSARDDVCYRAGDRPVRHVPEVADDHGERALDLLCGLRCCRFPAAVAAGTPRLGLPHRGRRCLVRPEPLILVESGHASCSQSCDGCVVHAHDR